MLYAIVVVLLLIADQGLKYWVTVHVPLDQAPNVLIPKLLDITNTHNYGIAFSWLQNMPSWIFALIAALFSVVVILALRRGMIHGKFGRWMAVLALAGAIGNCIDRVLSGYVVDMLVFAFWKSFPVFNLADACLVVGGVAFCLYVIFHKETEAAGASARARKPRQNSAAASENKPSLSDRLAERKAALQQSAVKRAEKREAEKKAAEAEKKETVARPKPERAEKPVAADDPFAAWDRAVSEQDARAKADEERRQAARAEREARRKAEQAAKAKAAEAVKTAEPKPAEPAKKPAVDNAPTRKVAAQKIEEMAAKLAPKKPEPKPAPAPVAEETVSYDLEDILNEFRDL